MARKSKAADADYRRKYYLANRDEALSKAAEYRARNRDAIAAKKSAARLANRDEANAKDRERWSARRATENAKRRAVNQSPEKRAEFLAKNREYMRAWTAKNRYRVAIARRARKFGTSVDALERLMELQKASCAICAAPLSFEDKSTHVDHSHATGAIRGLLCHSCNLMLGHSHDSIEKLEAAISYLKRTRE